VIGAGATGLEMAQAYRRLGSQVTVLDSSRALGDEDAELAGILLAGLAGEGIVIREGVRITRVSGTTGRIRVEIEGEPQAIDGGDIRVAAGRKPNVGDLGLQAAGITVSKAGIKVNAGLRTRNRRVYAIGDAAGGAQASHLAAEHADVVLKRVLFRSPARA